MYAIKRRVSVVDRKFLTAVGRIYSIDRSFYAVDPRFLTARRRKYTVARRILNVV
jgi:hypothetical protein